MTTEQVIQQELARINAGVLDIKTKTEKELATMRMRMNDLQVEQARPGAVHNNGSSVSFKSAGQRLIEQEAEMRDSLKRTRGYIFQAGSFYAPSETKSVVDSAALGLSTPGILSAERVADITPGARRRLMIRDLMRSKPITSAQADFIRENSFTSTASPQTESSAKAESTFDLDIASARVSTIAHYVNLSEQALDDLQGLREYVDSSLIYYLKLKEETEILSGDGLGSHMSGLTTNATPYAGTYAVGGDTKLDTLNWAALELQNADETPTGIVLNPVDYHRILALKDEAGGANKGSYIVGNPEGGFLQVPTIWGLPTVVTRSMASGKFLMGNFNMALMVDRMDATIDLSNSHASNFVENKVSIRAELRSTITIQRPGAFRYGSL